VCVSVLDSVRDRVDPMPQDRMRFGIIKSLLDTVVDMQSPDAPRALRSACETYGFFYLTNHGVEQRLVDQVCWGCEGLLL
jgi:hypothetical protein